MPIYTPGKVTLAKGQPVPNDPNFAFNSLLLHGNGTNGSTVITDSSGSPKTVTAVGNAQISTAIADPFGNSTRGVIALDGTGDYLSIPATTAFEYGTGDFTIECWIRFASVAGVQSLYDQRFTGDQGPQPVLYTNGTSLRYFFNGSDRITIATVAANQWYHLALSKQSSSIKAFIDGVQGGSTYVDATSYTTGPSVFIGNDTFTPAVFGFNGYIDDLRITKGVARYTATFTPPTLPFPDF